MFLKAKSSQFLLSAYWFSKIEKILLTDYSLLVDAHLYDVDRGISIRSKLKIPLSIIQQAERALVQYVMILRKIS